MKSKRRHQLYNLIGEPDLGGFMGTALIESDDSQYPVLQVSVWQDMDTDEIYSTDESGDRDNLPDVWDLATFQAEQDELEKGYLEHVAKTGNDYLKRMMDAGTNTVETWKLIFKVEGQVVNLECGALMPGGVPKPSYQLPEYVLTWGGAKSDGSTDVTPEIAYSCAYYTDGPYYYTKAQVVRPASEEEQIAFKKKWAARSLQARQDGPGLA